MHQYSNNTATKMELAFHQTHIFFWEQKSFIGGAVAVPPLHAQFPPHELQNKLPSQSAGCTMHHLDKERSRNS